jgi:hypothetical protein
LTELERICNKHGLKCIPTPKSDSFIACIPFLDSVGGKRFVHVKTTEGPHFFEFCVILGKRHGNFRKYKTIKGLISAINKQSWKAVNE